MAYISLTYPGIMRGPHEHVRQTDLFAFVSGEFEIYLWDMRRDSPTYRNFETIKAGLLQPLSLVVPPGIVHAYKNVGTEPATVINAPNQLFAGRRRAEPVDEIRHEDDSLANPYMAWLQLSEHQK